MNTVIRVTNVKIKNLKNVRDGKFKTNSSFKNYKQSDVLGFYGPNGSGKTAIVEAFNLLKLILQTTQLPQNSKKLIYYGETELDLYFEFIIVNVFGEFTAKYEVTFVEGKDQLKVLKEKLSYKENQKGKRYKNIIFKDKSAIGIRNKTLSHVPENTRVDLLVANKMSEESSTSFIFRKELSSICFTYLNEIEQEIMKNLKNNFNKDFHVIDNVNYGLLIANIVMPFNIHFENVRGRIPYELIDTMLLPIEVFNTLEKVIPQTNLVLKTIIPGLNIKVRKINEEKMDDGDDGVRFEILSIKEDIELPLRSESEGVVKIISILSTLIAVFNNPNACVVIDELDAGVFEYLLGELLEVLSENGAGQLFFTSHNLRILEVLPISNLWFTTLNKDARYLQLKGVKKLNNARDIYLRAVQLGGQEELIYGDTNLYDIKKSFRKAGEIIE